MCSKTAYCQQACCKIESCACCNATKELGTWNWEFAELIRAQVETTLAVVLATAVTESTVEAAPIARALTKTWLCLAKVCN